METMKHKLIHWVGHDECQNSSLDGGGGDNGTRLQPNERTY